MKLTEAQKAEKLKDLHFKAGVLIKRVNDSGLKQDYIANKMKVSNCTFSRFMNLKEGYVTNSFVFRLSNFFANEEL
jgi:predicted DNA-binding protein (UPF0251 family)